MKDIADKLNLSINAVSLALNDKTGVGEETKRLILNTAEEMGYLDQSVKYMQNYSNKNICVLLKNRFFRDFRFYGRVLLGIEEEAKKAQASARALFSGAGDIEHMPTTTLSDEDFTDGEVGILDLLLKGKMAPSRSEAKRLVMQGGVLIGDEKVESFSLTLPKEKFSGDGVIVKKGKKIFHRFTV